jgi:hypothetical protein
VYSTQTSTTLITVNNQSYTIDQLMFMTAKRTIQDGNFSGAALDDLMIKTEVVHPEQHTYTIIGVDGYQKTVSWDNMKNGVLTQEKQAVFSDLPKAFRIKDVVRIEVS